MDKIKLSGTFIGSCKYKAVLFLFLTAIVFLLTGSITYQQENNKMALIIVDVQMFYFPGGSTPLMNPEEASLNAGKILDTFRKNNMTVVHVRHNARTGAEIHPNVYPLDNEKVITKNEANSFSGTDLLDFLKEKEITSVVICGMMTHMCVEATTRAAHDLGFECTLIQDACTTRDLTYNDKIIKAEYVHFSTLSTLSRTYAKIIDAETWINNFRFEEIFE